jgi:hypothetical protein
LNIKKTLKIAMKKVLFGALVAVAAAFATDASAQEIKFSKDVHDYGTIQQQANGECSFEFKNTGKAPLIISNAQGSCGCTVPEWPKEPIAPGKSASIKVKYDTNRIGAISKTVTVTSNATNEPTKVLSIKGTVEAKKS